MEVARSGGPSSKQPRGSNIIEEPTTPPRRQSRQGRNDDEPIDVPGTPSKTKLLREDIIV
mgnify:CR=1 FL=1